MLLCMLYFSKLFILPLLEVTTEPVTTETKDTNTESSTGLPTIQTTAIYSRGKPLYTAVQRDICYYPLTVS